MKLGRFVVDTHVHGQRFAARKDLDRAQPQTEGQEWEALSRVMRDLVPYDNSGRLLYDMECYGVDMVVLLPAFGMTDALNAEMVEKHPDRFVAVCGAQAYRDRVVAGEETWSIEGVCRELDELLATGRYVGIGEVAPYMPQPTGPDRMVSREEAMHNCLAITEVAAKHGVSVRFHTGAPMGYAAPYSYGELGPVNYNPMWLHDVATAFPDVPVIFDHGGVQAWWSDRLVEECLHVAASHDNVYLETGLWWTELYERALMDPNVGADKLLWGTDWGASIDFHMQLGRTPPAYAVQQRRKGIVTHQVDFWGWSLREIAAVRMPQDELNLILGGNAARIFGLELPFTRLFRDRDV